MDTDPRQFEDPSPIGAIQPSLLPAVLVGLGAAALGGIVWVMVVALTGYEVGWIAWGIGALVGFGMSRATARRDTTVAGLAGALALGGLIIARVLIGEYVLPGATTDEVLADEELMIQAVLVDMEFQGDLPPELQEPYDALPAGAEIPDELYDGMLGAAAARLGPMPEAERKRVADQFSALVFGEVDGWSRVTAQLTLFDLLWVFLAVSSAWKMMSAPAVPEPEPASPESPA
jgi:hypothetical protein